jgi:hypothetical protein
MHKPLHVLCSLLPLDGAPLGMPRHSSARDQHVVRLTNQKPSNPAQPRKHFRNQSSHDAAPGSTKLHRGHTQRTAEENQRGAGPALQHSTTGRTSSGQQRNKAKEAQGQRGPASEFHAFARALKCRARGGEAEGGGGGEGENVVEGREEQLNQRWERTLEVAAM